jgi:hypothetical protein
MGIFLYSVWDELQPFSVICGVILSNNSVKSSLLHTRNQQKESWGTSSMPENNVNSIKSFIRKQKLYVVNIFNAWLYAHMFCLW